MRRRSIAVFVLGSMTALAAPVDDGSRTAAAPVELPTTLAELERQLAEVERSHRETQEALKVASARSELIEQRLIVRGRALTRLTRLGLLPLGDGLAALAAHAARIERLRRGIGRDLAEQRRLTKERQRLSRASEQIQLRRAALQVHQQTLDQAHTALLAAQDRARAFERAFLQGSGSGHTAVYGAGAGPADPADRGSGMAAIKGRLPFPVAGRTEVRSARRPGAGPGIELRAPLGTPVLAVFPGRVAFADRYGDYGLTVLIEHGERHYTVSANLNEVLVEVGDEIGTGARIGTIGDSGDGPHLYFEIRVGSETVDPGEWFGL